MDVDTVLNDFATTGRRLPVESMRWSAENWEIAGPRFLEVLERYVTGKDKSHDAETQLFFVLHLMGQEGHKEAFPLICHLLEDNTAVERLLGDGTTETLTGILIGTFDGNRQLLQSIIEDPKIDEFLRHAGIETWAYLTFEGVISHEDTRTYLRQLSKSMNAEPESYAWAGITDAIIGLGYDDMRPVAQDLIRRGLITKAILTMKVFDALMAHSLSDPAGEAAFEATHVGRIHDAISLLSNWAAFRNPEEDEGEVDDPLAGDEAEDLLALPEMPYMNPLKNVGRNDPCPCGSGKKYKKCCLE